MTREVVSALTQAAAAAATPPAHTAPIATQPALVSGCFYSSSSKA